MTEIDGATQVTQPVDAGATRADDSDHRARSVFRSWLLALNVTTALVAGAFAVGLSAPGGHFLILAISGLAGLAMIGCWLIIVLVGALRRLLRWELSIAVVPLVIAAVALLGVTSLPLQLRFALSRTAFEDAVTEVSGPDCEWSDDSERLGLFDVDARTQAGEVTLFHHGHWLFNSSGFAYSETEIETGVDFYGVCGYLSTSYTKVAPNWYSFSATDWRD